MDELGGQFVAPFAPWFLYKQAKRLENNRFKDKIMPFFTPGFYACPLHVACNRLTERNEAENVTDVGKKKRKFQPVNKNYV